MTKLRKVRGWTAPLLVLLVGLAACAQAENPSFPQPEVDYSHLGLSDAEAASLLSLDQVDDYPLYTMWHYADYGYEEFEGRAAADRLVNALGDHQETWACSLFAALTDPAARLFGRNFDWSFSPTVLLFTDPPDGYAAVAMVDIAYLGFAGELSEDLGARPIAELMSLLDAHHIPFDGLNEAGLAVGMAAVAAGQVPVDPAKETIGSLGIIRLMLDKAATVDEAIELLTGYNIDFEGGPPLHYLIADAGGDSALVEHYQGDIRVIRSETDWQVASNFLNSAVESPHGQCWRYDTLDEELETREGVLDHGGAMGLLADVAQIDTQWSVVYNQSSGETHIVMGQDYEQVYVFDLEMLEE